MKAMRTLLILLVAFIGITAFASGIMMLVRPNGSMLGMQEQQLQYTPFNSYIIPGIILGFVIGGINLVALFKILLHNKNTYHWTLAGGYAVCCWLLLQFLYLQAYYFLHVLYLLAGFLIIIISYQLLGKAVV